MEKEIENRKCLYFLKDKRLNDIVGAFLLRDVEVNQYFTELANDIKSPFYGRQDDFVIFKSGEVLDDNFSIVNDRIDVDIHLLSEFIDDARVKFQWMCSVLNYVPQGYVRMPKEEQDKIKEDIENAIKFYVELQTNNLKVSNLQGDDKDIEELL